MISISVLTKSKPPSAFRASQTTMRRASLAVMQWVARERAMGGARQAHLAAAAAAAADTMPLMRCRDRRQREQGSWQYYERGHGTWQYYVGGGGTGVMLGAMGIFGKSAAKEDAADTEVAAHNYDLYYHELLFFSQNLVTYTVKLT